MTRWQISFDRHLNKIIETAVKAGMPMEKAIYCATWTPSRRMHLMTEG